MWHTMSVEEVKTNLKTNLESGISDVEAKKRKKIYGENILAEKKKESIFKRFIEQFNDFMIIVLIFAAVISAIMAYFDGSNDYIEPIIIIAIVVFNAIMGLIQESKAEKSLEALKKLSAPTAKVKRDGKITIIPSKDVVPGDILILESGNFVAADCRLFKAYNLKIEESALTGETLPVLKDTEIKSLKKLAIGDISNMAFSTTIVINGHAEAIVTDTAMNTNVGKIAKMIIQNKSPETPLQKKLAVVGKALGIISLLICLAIFVIGVIKKISIEEMFMTSVGLAVAAIPEGLPAIVTIMLSIGVTKMAKKNAIIRKLPAVETLGSSSVICSDKTGTLTQNKMEVVKILDYLGNDNSNSIKFILSLGSMCNDSNISYDKNLTIVEGEPTENAIIYAGLKYSQNKEKLYKEMPRINEIPFDSTRKLMTTIHKIGNKYRVITKGAPDVLLNKCNRYYQNGNILSITPSIINSITSNNIDLSSDALRVLAVTYSDLDFLPSQLDSNIIENNLIFVGLIGMIDPPREGVKEAVLNCKHAGIKTVMITGDHILTAKAIAKKLGILNDNDISITGTELDLLPQRKLEKDIMKYSVFARVSPEHKVRIVKAFQSTGAVVAMTGDGVNDAPALKNADIGISMGLNGTDVAKNASDMILTDDNFVTITEAVKEGRHIYENIKKAVHFLISTNIGEIVTIFVGLLLGLEPPLLAIQLLWVNLVTDSFPAIGLGLEPTDKNIMNKKPINAKSGIFSDGLFRKVFFEGIMIGLLNLFAFALGTRLFSVEVGRTMAFVSLSLLELFHSFNIRSDDSIFEIGLFKNKYLLGAFALGAFLQILVVSIKPIASIFKSVPLNELQWLITIVISFTPIVIIEISKKLKELIFGKRVYTCNKVK